ncbi:MAG TPA: DUF58 domain-containing protein [Anaerolineae bacterium]|nr:DUF58 domain-containing protein [Anaerolineae bacterium]HXW00261.1 DUF58 domain-containing protein [Anaerolineae bacterium]
MRSLERSWVLFLMWLASLLGILAVGHPLFFNLFYLFGAILLLSYLWAWLNVHWVRVTRQTHSRQVQVSKFFEERFVLENTGPIPKLWIELKDNSDLPNHRASRVISNLGGKRQQSWHVRTPCYQRGRFTLGPIILYSSDPFGLFLLKKELPRSFTSHVVVYPMAVDLPAFQPPVGEQTGGDMIHRRTHYVTTNVSGIRNYVSGDSFNRIHWPSTARTGQLMVKEFELDPMADIWIFLDMEKRVQAGLKYAEIPPPVLPEVHWEKLPSFKLAPSTEEYGVAITASLSKHFLTQNRAVGLITYANAYHREIAQSDRGERQLTRIYEMLAVTQAHGLIPLAEVLAAEALRFSRNTTVIIVTPAIDPEWVAATRHLIDRGVRTTAIVIDPGSFGMPYNALETEIELTASYVPHYIVRQDDPLDQALANARSTR